MLAKEFIKNFIKSDFVYIQSLFMCLYFSSDTSFGSVYIVYKDGKRNLLGNVQHTTKTVQILKIHALLVRQLTIVKNSDIRLTRF